MRKYIIAGLLLLTCITVSGCKSNLWDTDNMWEVSPGASSDEESSEGPIQTYGEYDAPNEDVEK